MKTALSCMLALAPALCGAADLSGKWSGRYQLNSAGGTQESADVSMELKQTANEVTGTIGPSEGQQWPIAKGKLEANRLSFEVQTDGPLFKVELALLDDHLKGEAVGDAGGAAVSATLDLTRPAKSQPAPAAPESR